MSRLRSRAAVVALASLASGGSLLGCSRGGSTPPVPTVFEPTAYDFCANLEFAEQRCEFEQLDVASFEQRACLLQGWGLPARTEADEKAPEALWSDSRVAEVVFHVAQPSEMRLTTQARGFVAENETNAGRVLLNGAELARIALGPKWDGLSVLLPAEHQRPGDNHLVFEFEHARTASEAHGGESQSGMRFSAQFRSFLFERLDPEAAERVRWAQSRLPGGVALRVLSEDESALEQVSTSSLRFYLEMPHNARFRSQLAFLDSESSDPLPATFRLVVTPRGGTPEIAWERELTRGSLCDVEAPLERFGGQLACLEFEIASTGGSAAIGSWITPVLQGFVERKAPPAAAAAALREELRGVPVVAILLDACRADVLSCYGGRPGLTPNVDRLTSEGVQFERAHAVASYTMASVSSMLADRYTWEHGTYHEDHRLPDTFRTWPECFRDQGYRTVAIVHSINGSSRVGFERGFEEMIEVYRERSKSGRDVAFGEEALPPLERVLAADDGRPLFLWLHLIEPHRPYEPPAPWKGMFTEAHPSPLDGGVGTAKRIKQRDIIPTEQDIAYLKASYEENLAYVDSVLAEVRAKLEAAGIFDEAVVCLFADHGEAFLEHDGKNEAGVGHGLTTYQEMIRIPLVFRLPSRLESRGRASSLASGIDILPTLADLVGVEPPLGGRGRSLVPALRDSTHERDERLVAHAYCPREDRFLTMWSHWWKDFKLVYQSGTQPELFDLRADPGELHNLFQDERILAGYMQQSLQEFVGFDLGRGLRPGGESQAIEVDAQAMEMLSALGYAR